MIDPAEGVGEMSGKPDGERERDWRRRAKDITGGFGLHRWRGRKRGRPRANTWSVPLKGRGKGREKGDGKGEGEDGDGLRRTKTDVEL